MRQSSTIFKCNCDMLAVSMTLEVIISDTCFHPMRKQTQRSPSPSIYMSVSLASVTVDSVLPWGRRCKVGRCEELGSQDLPRRCEIEPTFLGLLWGYPRAEPLCEPSVLDPRQTFSFPLSPGAESTWPSREGGDGWGSVTGGSHVCVLTPVKMCAVWVCFCFAMGVGSTQLLLWKFYLNSRCPKVDGAEDLRQVMTGTWAHLSRSFTIWAAFVILVIKSNIYSLWKIQIRKEDKKIIHNPTTQRKTT